MAHEQAEKLLHPSFSLQDLPSRPSSAQSFLYKDEPAPRATRPTVTIVNYLRIGLRALVLLSSGLTLGLIARSFSLYSSAQNVSYGANSVDFKSEPTGNMDVWPKGISLVPSDIILIVASASVLMSLSFIVLGFLNMKQRSVKFEKASVIVSGLYVVAWVVGIVVFSAVSRAQTNSLGNYACSKSESVMDVVAKYSGVCSAQVSMTQALQ